MSRAFGVRLTDYDRGEWLLVSSGCGIMMAVMDAEPKFRYCVDLDEVPDKTQLGDWLEWAANRFDVIGIVGWFSLSDPAPLRKAVQGASDQHAEIFGYTPGTALGCKGFDSLADFLGALTNVVPKCRIG